MSFLDRRFAANYSRRYFAGDLAAEDAQDALQADLETMVVPPTQAELDGAAAKEREDSANLKGLPIGLTIEQARKNGYTE